MSSDEIVTTEDNGRISRLEEETEKSGIDVIIISTSVLMVDERDQTDTKTENVVTYFVEGNRIVYGLVGET